MARAKVQTALSSEVHEKLKKYCDENGKILYKVVDEAVLNYLGENERKVQLFGSDEKFKEALKEVIEDNKEGLEKLAKS